MFASGNMRKGMLILAMLPSSRLVAALFAPSPLRPSRLASSTAFARLPVSNSNPRVRSATIAPLASVPTPGPTASRRRRTSTRTMSASSPTLLSATEGVDAISISDSYDGGNGEFVSASILSDVDDDCDLLVNVKIKPDPFTELEQKRHFQYFSFRSAINRNSPAVRGIFSGKKSIKVKYALINAGEASYAGAFRGYSTFVTTKSPFDPDSWTRAADCGYANGCLTWSHVHELGGGSDSACFAYFPPCSYERHLGLVARCAEAKGAAVMSLGQTLSGREIDYVTVGTGPRKCWIIHRQHPGESMAEFYAEGLLTRLLGLDDKWDGVAERAREMYTFHIVPNINPDGSIGGYLRTNAAGSNLNREWCPSPAPPSDNGKTGDAAGQMYQAPTLERSPEVYHVLNRMKETGCDAFLDVHGDEGLPFNFLAGSEGMPVWGKRLESLHGAFLAAYERANGDMQARVSYEPDAPGEGKPNICSNQIGERFDCLSATLEMPFKEIHGRIPPEDGEEGSGGVGAGWGPERARRLGASVLDALCYVRPFLRDGGKFWEGLSKEDAYVRPTNKY